MLQRTLIDAVLHCDEMLCYPAVITLVSMLQWTSTFELRKLHHASKLQPTEAAVSFRWTRSWLCVMKVPRGTDSFHQPSPLSVWGHPGQSSQEPDSEVFCWGWPPLCLENFHKLKSKALNVASSPRRSLGFLLTQPPCSTCSVSFQSYSTSGKCHSVSCEARV